MTFVATHWQFITMLAFTAFAGVVLIVHGVRGWLEERRAKREARQWNAFAEPHEHLPTPLTGDGSVRTCLVCGLPMIGAYVSKVSGGSRVP